MRRYRQDQLKKRRAAARLISAGLDAAGGANGGSPVSMKQIKKLIARRDVLRSAKLRRAVELRYIEELSCEEAARRIGCSKWAFYKRLERAKKLLRDALKGGSEPPYEF